MGVVISARGPCRGVEVDEGRRFLAFGRVRCAVLQSPYLCFQTRLLSIHGLGRPVGGEGGGAHAEPRGPARRLCSLGSRTCSGLCPTILGAAGEQVSSGWSGFWCPPCRGDRCHVSSPQRRRAGRRCLQTRLSCNLCFSHDRHLGPRKPAVKSSLAWLSVFPTATPGCALEAAGPDDSL